MYVTDKNQIYPLTVALPAAMTVTRGLITVATDQSVINIWQQAIEQSTPDVEPQASN